MDVFVISHNSQDNTGTLSLSERESPSTWQRLSASAMNIEHRSVVNGQIRLPWHQMLSLLREFLPLQRSLQFRIRPDGTSRELLNRFVNEYRTTHAVRSGQVITLTEEVIQERLDDLGFTSRKRQLRTFQLRDVSRLISIPNGANFSVPGAGKTTVTLAVHLLTCTPDDKLLVVCPKSAFPAWNEILHECIEPDAGWVYNSGRFVNLSGLEPRTIIDLLSSNNHYFFTNYEHFVAKKDTFTFLLSTNSIHLVLDESHRMKAGELSQRGSTLLSIANLPKRKDILSGTPMPQSPADLQAQLDFLWPGSSLGTQVQRGEPPSTVIRGLYTRTTKVELNLPPVNRRFMQVAMSPPQAALYGIIRNDALSQLSSLRTSNAFDVVRARRSVMRLLQLASNPLLAIQGVATELEMDSGIIEAVRREPISPKMKAVCDLVRTNARDGRKTVIWTIFTQNILDFEQLLTDLNPVSIYGQVKTGDATDDFTREGKLRRFHEDQSCMILIANPAAAGEGISLHTVCHDAVYLDRSYVSTHYLQSIDRIHRLGLQPNTITNITIVQAAAPVGLGSIDFSVSRRLATKIRALEQLLDDRDLHLIALDEENALEPIDFEVDVDDLADLIEELEGRIAFDENDAS